MNILDIFRPLKKSTVQMYKELGTYKSTFAVFGDDIYKSELVRACIRPLAELSAKAEAKCGNKEIERMLNLQPNMYMNGHDMVRKIRNKVELLNTAFVYIERNNRLQAIGAYPVPYSYFEAVEYANGLFIKFYFSGNNEPMILPWEDLVVIRKDYNKSDISGDDNLAIVNTLEMLNTANQGLANSIKATANLRGILKSTKAMLAPELVKKQKDEFVKDYVSLENASGIASLDSTQEFIPINMSPMTASHEQMKEYKDDIFRYFGVNDDVLMAKMNTEELENFHKIRIEPFLIQLSLEFTSKIFGKKAGTSPEHEITYMTDRGQFMTITQKLEFFNKVVLYGGATINEFRHLMGYGDIDGGDVPIRRLDADYINTDEKPREGNQSSEEGENNGKEV